MAFDTLAIMLDCSRNAVYTQSALHRLILLMEKMGYNALMLYTEDTFELDGEPYFGYLRGRYTAEQIRETDAFAAAHGVELIPCIQTLAHLERLCRHNAYSGLFDIDDVLLCGSGQVYGLIDKMFDFCGKCFSTRRINIGMDEAHRIGLGRYLDQHGYTDRREILAGHLARVSAIAEKHGFTPLMWSDMFFRLKNGGAYYTDKLLMSSEDGAKVPENTGLIYWDYYSADFRHYDIMLENHAAMLPSERLWYAGGLWSWTGFCPHYKAGTASVLPALAACQKHGIRNVIITLWGDNGAECSPFASLPALYRVSLAARGADPTDAELADGFFRLCGVTFEDFLCLELPDAPGAFPGDADAEKNVGRMICNPSKYMLYQDPLLGLFDLKADAEQSAAYAERAARLLDIVKRAGEYAPLFEAAGRLCLLLSHKYNLGARLRAAYRESREAVAALLPELELARSCSADFRSAYRAMWMSERKPQGYEVTDIRLGGTEARLDTALYRVRAYTDGDLECLEELEERILPIPAGTDNPARALNYNSWTNTASTSGISGI